MPQATTMQRLLLASASVRAALIVWGAVQDAVMQVKYTDIDYLVFTDAARYVVAGESPFLRNTYRYTPLLAYLLVPNVLFTPLWGKLLFAAGDVLAAWQIASLCRAQRASERAALVAVVAWLYNPFTVTISTRGSCDVLVANLLLGALACLFRGRRVPAALLYGLAVHSRIYPIVYAPAIVLFLARRALGKQGAARASWQALAGQVLAQGAAFGLVSGGTFLGLGALFYRLYGHTFLHEAFLYHLGRRDPRHSFSLYFYPVYLSFSGPPGGGGAVAAWLPDPGTLAPLPQAAVLLAAAVGLHAHLPVAWLVQTVAFVAFNKVATAQYFVWYYSLLPLVLPQLPWPPPRALAVAAGAWVATQLHWLAWAYALEFRGAGVYLPLWGASCAFLAANAALLAALLRALRPTRSFLELSVAAAPSSSESKRA